MTFQYSQNFFSLLEKLPDPKSFYAGTSLPGSFALPDNILLFHHSYSYQAPITHGRHTLVLPMGRMIYYIDRQMFDISPGDILYLPPYSSRYLHLQSETYHRLFITFELAGIQTYLPANNQNRLPENAENYVQKLLELFPDGDALELSISLFGLLTNLTPVAPATAAPRLSSKTAAVRSFIDKNLHNRLDNQLLAENVSMSASNLARKFRQEMGQSLHDYIASQRLEAARYFLEKTDMRMDEIAEACGFLSSSSFSHFFSSRTGSSPLAYRKQRQSASMDFQQELSGSNDFG